MSATRQRLPNRRELLRETIDWRGRRYEIDIGFDPVTQHTREVFLAGAKEGSEMQAVLADVAILLSILLQSGLKASLLANSMSRLPHWDNERDLSRAPASVIAAVLDVLCRYEAEDPPTAGERLVPPFPQEAVE